MAESGKFSRFLNSFQEPEKEERQPTRATSKPAAPRRAPARKAVRTTARRSTKG